MTGGKSELAGLREPVRVCFVIDRLTAGGTELHLLRLMQHLDRARVQPSLCLLKGDDAESRSMEPRDCPVLRLGVRSLHHYTTLSRAWQFARFLRRERVDIVQPYFPDSTYFSVLVAKLAGVRRIVRTRRNLGYWMKPVDRWLGRVYGRMVHVTLVNCEACRQAVIEQEGARPDSVVVIENGIDLEPFRAIPPLEPHVNGRVRRVGMVANLRPVKGADVFVRAAALLAEDHPNVRFQIAGTGDDAWVRQVARECGIEDRLDLLGRVTDIPAFLQTLDVAVLPSHSEGLSNALLEYMAAGRPIVATAVGGNVELVEDGVTGLLVPPGEPPSLAKLIHRILDDSTLAVRLGAAVQRQVRDHFGLDTMIQRYHEFYGNLFYDRAARPTLP
ncbi:MAG: glycosyltransferase [Pirellulales bacterium]